MAEKVLPNYVARIDARGRRFFKPEFVKACVADLKSKRATVRELTRKFELSESLLRGWTKGRTSQWPGGNRRRTTRKAAVPNSELLEKALKYDSARNPAEASDRWQISAEHVGLAIAYCQGRISRNAVNAALRGALGHNHKVATSTWLGAVLKWALAHGYKLEAS